MKPALTLAEADRIRARRQQAVLLYLTDRCPVGCSHCSVSALRDGPRPGRELDRELVVRLVDELCDTPRVRLVGISGGEPFTERRMLGEVTARLAGAGKLIVLYTSGVWGRTDGTAPDWTRTVLARASCVVLSTDAQHAERVPQACYVAALRATADAGTWIAVQVIAAQGQRAAAERLLTAAFGAGWNDWAEIRNTELVRRGRAAVPQPDGTGHGAGNSTGRDTGGGLPSAGPCHLAGAPVVRYDGRIAACCNEDVVTGAGPAALQAAAEDPLGLRESLARLRNDPYLRAVRSAGPGALALLPRYREVATAGHGDGCELCWTLLDHGAHDDPMVALLGRNVPGDDPMATLPGHDMPGDHPQPAAGQPQ